jgi:glyoxylase-like metal-dependent hydrolase (beta-lactamase superfamily II)
MAATVAGEAAQGKSAMEMARGVVRLRADNPGPMTGSGTNSYVLQGPDGAVVIDPGPALPAHLEAILRAVADAPLRAILVSHAHLDHSALAPALAALTGAQILGFGGAVAGRSAVMQQLAKAMPGGGEGIDAGFVPDVLLRHGQVVQLAGLDIEVLHTPGHMGGHLCFGLGDRLFSGDHVMGWSTSLVSPPDGDMGDYMRSLALLAAREWQVFWPGHGAAVEDPAARLAALIQHRRDREAAICAALSAGPLAAEALAARIYTQTPTALLPAAARNILAHLIDLHDRKIVATPDAIGPAARFTMN